MHLSLKCFPPDGCSPYAGRISATIQTAIKTALG